MRNLVDSALRISCSHSIGSALQGLFNRFSVAGFSEDFVFRQLLYRVNTRNKCSKVRESARRVVLPFFDRISHNLKSGGSRYGISTVYRHDFKLSQF